MEGVGRGGACVPGGGWGGGGGHGVKYPRRIRSLLLCLRDVFPVLNISPVFVDLPLVDLMHRVFT